MQPSDFPESVSATWTMSTGLLTSDAQHIFNLCAFFSPEPIAAELVLNKAEAISDPPGLSELLSSTPRFRGAASQLNRLSLAKVDGARDQIQMHRVVQAVTKGQLRQSRQDLYLAYQAAVDTLLAESNPGNPDRGGNDTMYDLSSSTSSPTVISSIRAIQPCSGSSSIRSDGCTCGEAMSRRCSSGRMH